MRFFCSGVRRQTSVDRGHVLYGDDRELVVASGFVRKAFCITLNDYDMVVIKIKIKL